MPRALLVSPDGLLGAAHPDIAVIAVMLRGPLDVRLAGDQAARDHGAGDQAARDHDVARAARDDAVLDDAAIDHDLRARRNAGHHYKGLRAASSVRLRATRTSVLRLLSVARGPHRAISG